MLKLKTVFCIAACLDGSICNAQTLNILTWEAFFSDATIAQWEARTGASVTQVFFDQEEVRNSILLSPEVSDIDIVSLDPITASVIGQHDVLLPLEQYHNSPNFHHFDSRLAERCAPYASPYLWGTLGIVYRKDRLSEAPTSWKDLVEPREELQGHIGWVENYIDTLAPALLMRDESAASEDEGLLKEVFEQMKTLLPAILTFDYAISFLSESDNADDLHMALAYSGDQMPLNRLSPTQQWEYVVPEEGSIIWSECLAILKSSDQQRLAMDFINFINTPEIAAANSDALQIATSNAAAVALQNNAIGNDPSSAQESLQPARLIDYDQDISVQNILLRDRITSTLVELHESQ